MRVCGHCNHGWIAHGKFPFCSLFIYFILFLLFDSIALNSFICGSQSPLRARTNTIDSFVFFLFGRLRRIERDVSTFFLNCMCIVIESMWIAQYVYGMGLFIDWMIAMHRLWSYNLICLCVYVCILLSATADLCHLCAIFTLETLCFCYLAIFLMCEGGLSFSLSLSYTHNTHTIGIIECLFSRSLSNKLISSIDDRQTETSLTVARAPKRKTRANSVCVCEYETSPITMIKCVNVVGPCQICSC